MKKLLLAFACIAFFSFSSQAQVSPHALGLRLGGGNGFGAEFSYQHGLSSSNRLEFDLGFRSEHDYNAFKVTGIYQWVWNIDGGFNWYAGVGAGIGNVNIKNHYYHDDGVFAFIAGNIGIEYNFDVPLQIFLDFRPEFVLANYDAYDNFGPDFAIGIRYRF